MASILHIQDEIAWGLVPEDVGRRLGGSMVKGLSHLLDMPGRDNFEIMIEEGGDLLTNLTQGLAQIAKYGGDLIDKGKPVYPFTAIVGQDEMKEALLLNVVNPSIGGVLIRGEKGTAKSTAVRALADLLPQRTVVAGCPCGCTWGDWDRACPICQERREGGEGLKEAVVAMRVIELPLSSTEDRVAGTLDMEHALRTGKKKFEPGVLAKANGNILYVDEVNLLDAHLVDLLLDAAAMGTNFVEREGVSFSHPARFTLVGTMNPEEGDLRPQLLDRFGLLVDVKAEQEVKQRMEVIRRRIAFERDPQEFCEEHKGEQDRCGWR